GRERPFRRLDVEGVRRCDDHRLQLGIGEHLVIVEPGLCRTVETGHALDEVLGHIADRMEVDIARLLGGLEMRELGDRPAAEDADLQPPLLLLYRQGAPFPYTRN